jgi:hypothetical protein
VEAAEAAKVGISDFAQEELGDIVYVDLPEVRGRAGSSDGRLQTLRHAVYVRRWAQSSRRGRHSPLWRV